MGFLVALFVALNARRLLTLGAIICCAILLNHSNETDNRRYVADTWLRAIPASYYPVCLPNHYSRFVEDPSSLTLARLDTIVRWHQPDTVILLYDQTRRLGLTDSIGPVFADRPVLVLDAALGFAPGAGYDTSNRRVAGALSSSRSLVVGTPLQTAGVVAYFMRERGYSRLRINLVVDWEPAQPLYGDYVEVMAPFD